MSAYPGFRPWDIEQFTKRELQALIDGLLKKGQT